MEAFTVREIAPNAVSQALPLLQATWPTIDLRIWQSFAKAFCGEEIGLPTISYMFDSSGGMCGLFASRIEHILRNGHILGIPLFGVVDIGNSHVPIRRLLEAVAAMAEKHGCAGFAIHLDIKQRELLNRLRPFHLERSFILSSPTLPPAH